MQEIGVVGGGKLLQYGAEDETPHIPEDHPLWQESVVLFWWDSDQNIGGYHRIGHEPNYKNGAQAILWNVIFSPDAIFKRDAILPLRASDTTSTGFNCGDDTCTFEYTDHAIWRINETDVQAELHVSDQHPPIDIYPKSGTLGEDVAPNHMEVGSKVSGNVHINGKDYQVNGLAFRDHGWGMRDWSTFVSHRWIAGVGDGFSFLALTFHSSDNEFVKFGCVIQGNQLTYAKEVDIITFFEADGLTHRGGTVDMTLSTNKKVHIDCTPLQKGAVMWAHNIACVDTICKATLQGLEGGILEGICDFEVTNNALHGEYRPQLAFNAITKNGLTKL